MLVTIAIVSLTFRPALFPTPRVARMASPAMQLGAYRPESAAERAAARNAAQGVVPPPPAGADDATFVGQVQPPRYAQPPLQQPPLQQPPLQQQQSFTAQPQMSRAQQLRESQNAAFGYKPQASAGAPQLNRQDVDQMLAEFCTSDYARQLCDYCNVGPMDYGKVSGMFESVRIIDSKLLVKLARPFQQRSEKLFDKLSRHIRQRMPEVERLMHESGSPATIRTYIL